jgi:hypothetical protein
MQEETVVTDEERLETAEMGSVPLLPVGKTEPEIAAISGILDPSTEVEQHVESEVSDDMAIELTEVTANYEADHADDVTNEAIVETVGDITNEVIVETVGDVTNESIVEKADAVMYKSADGTDMEGEDYIIGDDDVAPVDIEVSELPHPDATRSSAISSPAPPDPQDLLAGGIRFLSGLAKTLSSTEATQQLVSSIVERDEKTGRSYMKIPVDDQQTVVNVMNMLGQLLRGFGK